MSWQSTYDWTGERTRSRRRRSIASVILLIAAGAAIAAFVLTQILWHAV